jgi:hypothetical protein
MGHSFNCVQARRFRLARYRVIRNRRVWYRHIGYRVFDYWLTGYRHGRSRSLAPNLSYRLIGCWLLLVAVTSSTMLSR